MSRTIRKPNIDSAAVTARTISRRLRKAGFKMADTSDRYAWTEGLHVSRVGCGRSVQVGWHFTHSQRANGARMKGHAEFTRARDQLKAWGYEDDDCGWITCEGP